MIVFVSVRSGDKIEHRNLTVEDIPGPRSFPILGTRWIFSWFGYYRMDKIHDAYKGNKIRTFFLLIKINNHELFDKIHDNNS